MWVALQQLAHRFQGFLALGRVARPRGRHDIVLAHAGVVDRVNHNVVSVADFPHWHRLLWVDLRHLCLAVFANRSGNTLRVVDFWDQINQLACDVTNTASQVVAVVVRANITLTLTRKDGFSASFVAALA